jgi:hypothetical protein
MALLIAMTPEKFKSTGSLRKSQTSRTQWEDRLAISVREEWLSTNTAA